MKKKPKILIAEDEDALRLLTRETLASQDAELFEASDGLEALEIARREMPELLLLDVAMPGLTGFEVCEKLKSDPDTAGIVIVMLTAHGQGSDRARAVAVGADHFMTKPFSPVQLIRLVGQIL
ncbi:MAG: response regulator [Chloroflexi bacterium]|uniref:Response regulator n=1 Tax=Candidatus Chlorohelix allophototropha TaxID=3003348 RepID=A0A8T7LZ17_9CHLR|nr:response regulator [Chloroflexota bacterium]WJW65684.1 response regulator [Chloroflexota bacterium L227-S17]